MASRQTQIVYARRRRRKYEARLEAVFQQSMSRVYNEILKRNDVPGITSKSLVAAINDPNQLAPMLALWRTQVDKTLIPTILGVFRSAARDTLALPRLQALSQALGPTFLDNIRNVRADEFLATVDNRLVGIGDTAFQDSQEALRQAIDEGLSVPKQADAVRRQLAIGIRRATMIARTEAGAAIGAADQAVGEEYAKEGWTVTKEWLATSDTRTREDHRNADGQKVPIDHAFIVGGVSMMHPGDPSAPADQTIQCRCTTITDVEDD